MNEYLEVESGKYENGAMFFEAFAEPARIHLVYLLHTKGTLNIAKLQSETGYSQPKVSRHMQYLKGRDIVKVKKNGKERDYAINYNYKPMKMFLALLETGWLNA